ncbi:MAG TPA: T9SS type A sorting domain-containing protein [Bacteroidota bacterium]
MKRMLRLLIVTAVLTPGHVHPLIAQWVKTSGAGSANVTNLAVSSSNLFAGFNTAYNSGGVILSTDDGTTWSGASSGLPSVSVTALAAFGTNLFAGGDSSGVLRRPLSEMITSVEQSPAGLPAEFSLSQNYPNPFNPTTTIWYTIPQRSQVTLTVFNSLGQPVSTLVSGTEEGGYHEVRFNGTNLASGVYFYRIQAEGFVQTRKLVLLR